MSNVITIAAGGAIPPVRQITTVFAYFLALSLATGLTMALAFLLPRDAAAQRGAVAARLRSFAGPVAVVVLIGGYLQYVQRIVKADFGYTWAQAAVPTHVVEFLRVPKQEGTWVSAGIMGTVQLAAFIVLAALLVGIGRTTGRRLPIAGFAVSIFAAAAPSLTLATLELDAIASRELKLVHILSADVWIGGILVLAAAGILSLRTAGNADPGQQLADAGVWDHLWSRFSTWAMAAVIAITLSGIWMTWVHLGSFSQFVTTPYGRFLLIKLILVAYMVAAGTYNALVLIPRIRRARLADDGRTYVQLALEKFPRIVAGEALAAVAILAIVPFLAGSARKQAGAAAAGPFDWGTFGLGAALLLLAAFSCAMTVRSLERRDLAGAATA